MKWMHLPVRYLKLHVFFGSRFSYKVTAVVRGTELILRQFKQPQKLSVPDIPRTKNNIDYPVWRLANSSEGRLLADVECFHPRRHSITTDVSEPLILYGMFCCWDGWYKRLMDVDTVEWADLTIWISMYFLLNLGYVGEAEVTYFQDSDKNLDLLWTLWRVVSTLSEGLYYSFVPLHYVHWHPALDWIKLEWNGLVWTRVD